MSGPTTANHATTMEVFVSSPETVTSDLGAPSGSPPRPKKQASAPSYLQGTSAQADHGEKVRKSPKERAAARRAEAEANGTAQTGAPQPPAMRKAASTPGRKNPAPAPAPVVSWKDRGINLGKALGQASWGIKLAKAFAPKVELGARNRVKVGVRFRPMSEGEEKRGEAQKLTAKGGGYLELELATSQLTLTHPRPQPGQNAKVDMFAFDHLYGPKTGTKKVFQDLALPLVHYLLEGYNGTIFAVRCQATLLSPNILRARVHRVASRVAAGRACTHHTGCELCPRVRHRSMAKRAAARRTRSWAARRSRAWCRAAARSCASVCTRSTARGAPRGASRPRICKSTARCCTTCSRGRASRRPAPPAATTRRT